MDVNAPKSSRNVKNEAQGSFSFFLLESLNPRSVCDLSPLWTRGFIPSPLRRKLVSINPLPIFAKNIPGKIQESESPK